MHTRRITRATPQQIRNKGVTFRNSLSRLDTECSVGGRDADRYAGRDDLHPVEPKKTLRDLDLGIGERGTVRSREALPPGLAIFQAEQRLTRPAFESTVDLRVDDLREG